MMIKTKQELFEVIKNEKIPLNMDAIWRGDLHDKVKYTCQSPKLMFDAFLKSPEMFPFPEDILILWVTNGNAVTAYLKTQKKYIRYYVEDGPDDYEVLGLTYQQMMSDLFGKLISRQTSTEDLKELALFFSFNYLESLEQYVKEDPDWEETTADFIASIE